MWQSPTRPEGHLGGDHVFLYLNMSSDHAFYGNYESDKLLSNAMTIRSDLMPNNSGLGKWSLVSPF